MAKERIDKLLSHEGFGSRKDIKKLLRTACVLVNDKQIFDPGFLLDTENDTLFIDDEEINLHSQTYLMMNKVMHTVSSNKDGEHETVFDLLDEKYHTPYLEDHLHLIGRLDMDTEGLLIFTTDGALTHRLISPKSHVSKTYFCILEKEESQAHKEETAKRFFEGIHIAADDNEPEADCLPGATVTWPDEEQALQYLTNSSVTFNDIQNRAALLTIYEGKYHQVKRMFAAAGNKVIYLKRISMGQLKLDKTLTPGEYKELSENDIDLLINQ